MSARSCFPLSALLGLLTVPLLTLSLAAQEAVQVQPAVENSRFQFSGVVNSPDVYLRSGPGEEWYATEKLPQGSAVTVVGIKFDWLKITPPSDAFCYVSKLYVDRRGDGSIGRVTHPNINVRAGSATTAVKSTVLAQLNVGDEVKILGEEDEYYKIAPPPGAYLYVNKQFIDPVKAVAVNASAKSPDVVIADAPATQPAETLATDTPTTQPTAQAPAGPTPEELATTQFDALETEFAAASQKPLEEQPAADLAKRYEALTKNTALPAADQQTAGFRLAVLKVRLDAQARLADLHKSDDAAAQQAKLLTTERDELQKRLDANQVTLYAAVGQLETSSLQFGAGTLYRLVDPATGRTLIYLRGQDADAVKLMGQFVGVRGDPIIDERLNVKVIPCTVIETVDPAQVNTKVMAGITPQSLVSSAVQASSGN
jgi:uncharacterized protein YgiM (DUF1202 family)